MADVKLSQLAANSPASVAAGAQLWSGRAGIYGLFLEYVSGTQLRVSSGAAYVQDAGALVELPTSLTKTISGIGNNAWGHVYLLYSAGVAADVEVVTAAPAAPYFGRARGKSGTGGTSRRYLGSVLTDASGAIYRFQHSGDDIHYLTNLFPPFRVLNGGVATVRTNVDLSGAVPVTSTVLYGNAINNSDQVLLLDVPEIGNAAGASRLSFMANQRAPFTAAVPSRTLVYQFPSAPGSGAGFIDVWGYKFDR